MPAAGHGNPIRDRDGKFPALFDTILADAGIETVLSGIQMPRMNSIMERWVQTCRRELLDRTLIWNQPHLLHALREFEQFYNGHRPHQGIANARPLEPLPVPLVVPDQSPALTDDDATDSVGYFMSISVRHELHGWGFRQGQRSPTGKARPSHPKTPITAISTRRFPPGPARAASRSCSRPGPRSRRRRRSSRR